MTQDSAMEMLRAMLKACQRFRSITAETCGEGEKAFLPVMYPWIYGPKCILEPLAGIIDRAETSGNLPPGDVFNMLTVLYNFIPELLLVAASCAPGVLPDAAPPPASYLRGWEVSPPIT